MSHKPASPNGKAPDEDKSREELIQELRALREEHDRLAQEHETLRRMTPPPSWRSKGPTAYLELKANGTITRSNHMADQLFGVAAMTLPNQLLLPRIAQNHRPLLIEHLQATLTSQRPQTCQLDMYKSDGTPFTSYVSSIVISPGDRSETISMALFDITEQANATQTLQNQTQSLRAQLDQAPIGILKLDHLGFITDDNPQAQRLLGTPHLRGEHIADFWLDSLLDNQKPFRVTEDSIPEPLPARTQWPDHFRRHRQWEGYLRPAFHKDNQRLYHVQFLVIHSEEDGEPICMEGIISDVTELTYLQAHKDEFTSIISHELRTPLTSLIGSLKLLRSGMILDLNERSLQMLDIAQRNADRLLYLINDILDIGKLEAGGLELKCQRTELFPLIMKTLEDTAKYAETYDVEWRFRNTPADAIVYVDPIRLQQVLANLLSNAAKFSGKSQYVKVDVRRNDGKLEIRVIDWGEGVQPSFQPLLFRKFAQQDTVTARKNKGTGLGLYISKQLIDEMEGQLAYEPNPEGGAVFVITLPEYIPHN